MITIASKDAGGAEILSSWVIHNPGNYKYYLSGPAIKIFKSKIKKIKISKIDECLNSSDSIISSTGTTKFEIKAIQKFNKNNKKTTAYLDHWVNYKKRFLLGNQSIKVDEIWVNDTLAFQEAKKCFKNNVIKKKKNFYLSDFSKKIKKYKQNKNCILYLTDNKKNLKLKKNIELLLFKYFLKNIYFKKFSKKKHRLIIRVHPNDTALKYKKNIINKNLIKISKNKLALDISKSLYVYGNNSMALYLARSAGIKNCYNFIINNNYKYQNIMKKFRIKACRVKI